jgi:hypothetical protein
MPRGRFIPGQLASTIAGEDEFETWVLARAGERGWCGFHVRYSEASVRGIHRVETGADHSCGYGWPDWVFARDGQVIFRELKTEQGQTSKHQKHWIALLASAGLDVDIWRPRDEVRILRELASPLR